MGRHSPTKVTVKFKLTTDAKRCPIDHERFPYIQDRRCQYVQTSRNRCLHVMAHKIQLPQVISLPYMR